MMEYIVLLDTKTGEQSFGCESIRAAVMLAQDEAQREDVYHATVLWVTHSKTFRGKAHITTIEAR